MRPSLLLALALPVAGGCHSHEAGEGPRADEFFYECGSRPAGVEIAATDESFAEMINKEAAGAVKTDDAQAPRLERPAPGGALSASAPPEVRFRVGSTAARPRPGPWAPPGRRAPRRSWLGRLLAWEGVAHAHCAPVTGENYLFRLTAEGETTPLYTAQLSVTAFSPSAEKWKRALAPAVGRTVVLTLARAVYSRGTITSGPFVGSALLRFTVGP